MRSALEKTELLEGRGMPEPLAQEPRYHACDGDGLPSSLGVRGLGFRVYRV